MALNRRRSSSRFLPSLESGHALPSVDRWPNGELTILAGSVLVDPTALRAIGSVATNQMRAINSWLPIAKQPSLSICGSDSLFLITKLTLNLILSHPHDALPDPKSVKPLLRSPNFSHINHQTWRPTLKTCHVLIQMLGLGSD